MDLDSMLRCKAGEKDCQLFTLWCAKGVLPLIPKLNNYDYRAEQALNIVEGYIKGETIYIPGYTEELRLATKEDLEYAIFEANAISKRLEDSGSEQAAEAFFWALTAFADAPNTNPWVRTDEVPSRDEIKSTHNGAVLAAYYSRKAIVAAKNTAVTVQRTKIGMCVALLGYVLVFSSFQAPITWLNLFVWGVLYIYARVIAEASVRRRVEHRVINDQQKALDQIMKSGEADAMNCWTY